MKRLTPLLIVTALFVLSAAPAQAVQQTVDITGSSFNGAFSPVTKAIALGDTVKWTNRGSAQHTSTGDSPLKYWDSFGLSTGQSYTTKPFTAAGSYPYHCAIHSNMKGTIQTPLTLTKSGRRITLKLATVAAPTGYKYAIQRKVGTSYSNVASVPSATYVFNATAAGTYTFRAALQKGTTVPPAAFFSLPTSITVS